MIDVENDLQEFPLVSLNTGDYLISQGDKTDTLFFLFEGSVKIIRNGYDIAVRSEKGSVLGEMSIFLDQENSASVQCLKDSSFYKIERPKDYLETHPKIIWHITQILSLRLFNLTQYLVDVKSQYEGHDHLEMVDEVLQSLLHQQKTNVLTRPESRRDTPDY